MGKVASRCLFTSVAIALSGAAFAEGTSPSGAHNPAASSSALSSSTSSNPPGLNDNGERTAQGAPAAASVADQATPTPELDKAVRDSDRQTRQEVARKGQLMHSITPRSGADRSDQMPDDPVSPALTR